jgi:DNA-binding transcriptional ArsR family regulator
VSEIASAIDCSLQNTSQHLRLMKDKNILASRRAGQTIYYRIRPNKSMEGCQLLFQARRGLLAQEKSVESV